MKSDAQPKFYKARPVPYSLQEAVKAEYSQLEAESIVEKVEFGEWATPMVHVPKSDGTTRSCKDYAVTVNPQLNVPQYPILLPEDVFVKLQGGQRFTELDLKGAYQQLPLDPDSQTFVTIPTEDYTPTRDCPLVLLHHLLYSSVPWMSFFKVLTIWQASRTISLSLVEMMITTPRT